MLSVSNMEAIPAIIRCKIDTSPPKRRKKKPKRKRLLIPLPFPFPQSPSSRWSRKKPNPSSCLLKTEIVKT